MTDGDKRACWRVEVDLDREASVMWNSGERVSVEFERRATVVGGVMGFLDRRWNASDTSCIGTNSREDCCEVGDLRVGAVVVGPVISRL